MFLFIHIYPGILRFLIITALLYVFIGAIWRMIERFAYGEATPMWTDDIFAILLAVSIYFHIYD